MIAIYHGFPDIHYEMLGYLLEYCTNRKLDYTLYAHANNFHGWLDMYIERFPNMKLLPPTHLNPDDHTVIVLVTDDDPTFKQEWRETQKHKILYIHHFHVHRFSCQHSIGTRFYPSMPHQAWAIPCWNVLGAQEKLALLSNDATPHVALVGVSNVPASYEDLRHVFSNPDDIVFHVVNRTIHHKINAPNIVYHEGVSAKEMIDILGKCHFAACMEEVHRREHLLSAIVALAFGTKCALIMPTSWPAMYKLHSPVVYDQKIHISTDMFDVNRVDAEFCELTSQRDNLLDNFLYRV